MNISRNTRLSDLEVIFMFLYITERKFVASACLNNINDDLLSYRIWLYFRVSNPITMILTLYVTRSVVLRWKEIRELSICMT